MSNENITLFLTRDRAATAATRAMLRLRDAVDAKVSPSTSRCRDGSVDYGFKVMLFDAAKRPILVL